MGLLETAVALVKLGVAGAAIATLLMSFKISKDLIEGKHTGGEFKLRQSEGTAFRRHAMILAVVGILGSLVEVVIHGYIDETPTKVQITLSPKQLPDGVGLPVFETFNNKPLVGPGEVYIVRVGAMLAVAIDPVISPLTTRISNQQAEIQAFRQQSAAKDDGPEAVSGGVN